MNKKAILITLIAVAVIAAFAVLVAGGVIDLKPKSATEKEFGKTVIRAEMTVVGYEDKRVEIELYPDVAPITVDNFVKLCESGFYNGLIFHRIVPNVIVQTGSPTGTGYGGSDVAIKGEFAANGVNNPIRHRNGVLSMARLENNYNSATSQFFIVTCGEGSSVAEFDGQYAAFGRVVSGMEVIDAISAVQIDENGRPVDPPVIKTITVKR